MRSFKKCRTPLQRRLNDDPALANAQILLSMNTKAGLNCGGPPPLGMILMQSLLSPFLSSSKNACGSKPGAAIVSSTSWMVIPTKAGEHSPIGRGTADATPVDPMASHSAMAEMATLVLPMLFPRAYVVAKRRLPAARGSILLRLESPCQEGRAGDFQEVQEAIGRAAKIRSFTN